MWLGGLGLGRWMEGVGRKLGGASNRICAGVGGGPLPRPLPVRSSRRGENSIALRLAWPRGAGAPSGSLRLATSPKTAGGGWVADGSRLDDEIGLRPTGPPSPGPSPFVPHGEGRIRSRCDQVRCEGRAPPPARLGSPPPQNCWGRLEWPTGRGSTTETGLRPTGGAPLRPLPHKPHGRGEFDRAPDILSSASPSPARFAGEGRGGGHRRTPARCLSNLSDPARGVSSIYYRAGVGASAGRGLPPSTTHRHSPLGWRRQMVRYLE